MNVGKIRNPLEWIVGVTFVLGIVTASLNVRLAGFVSRGLDESYLT